MNSPENAPQRTSFDILTVCGSLRQSSVNAQLLRTAASITDPQRWVHDRYLRTLPLFNPEMEEDPGEAVLSFRALVRQSRGVVIASPEYAHGIPGGLKNALDWLVGSGELDSKPTLVLCAAKRSEHAPQQLAEVLRTQGALVFGPDTPGLSMNPEVARQQLTDEAVRAALVDILRPFLGHLASA